MPRARGAIGGGHCPLLLLCLVVGGNGEQGGVCQFVSHQGAHLHSSMHQVIPGWWNGGASARTQHGPNAAHHLLFMQHQMAMLANTYSVHAVRGNKDSHCSHLHSGCTIAASTAAAAAATAAAVWWARPGAAGASPEACPSQTQPVGWPGERGPALCTALPPSCRAAVSRHTRPLWWPATASLQSGHDTNFKTDCPIRGSWIPHMSMNLYRSHHQASFCFLLWF